MPGKFPALGTLLLGIGEGAVGKQESGYLLAHVFQLLTERLASPLGLGL